MSASPRSSESTKSSFNLLNHQVNNLFKFFDNVDLSQATPQAIKEQLDQRREKLLRSLRSTRHVVNQQVRDRQKRVTESMKRKLRTIVVGDPDASIRKFVHEPPQVKLLDKACFAFSLIHVGLSEYIVLGYPQYFHTYFLAMSVPLMTFRYVDYKAKKWHHFMFDLCYFINFLCITQSLFFYSNPHFFELLFIFANGPVLLGIVVWRNSMVFHSVDKMTSLFLHAFPPLYTYCHRWLVFSSSEIAAVCSEPDCAMTWNALVFNFCTVYAMWQVLYLIKTEIVDGIKIRSDSNIQTSVTWILQDPKNVMTKTFSKLFRRVGVMKKDEVLDPGSLKGKALFFLVMGVYTIATVLPAKFMFEYKIVHLVCLLGTVLAAVFNGANYYIEVFAKRYLNDMERKAREMELTYDELRQTVEELSYADALHSDIDTDTEDATFLNHKQDQ